MINVRQVDGTGHICELQIHINAMLAVKSGGGGHVAYKAARVLQLFHEDISVYQGKAVLLSADKSARSALVRLSKGQLKELDFSLTRMTIELAHDMAQALAAPSCKVIKMCAGTGEWDAGVKMEDVYTEKACRNVASSLEYINISNASKILKGSSLSPHLRFLKNLVILVRLGGSFPIVSGHDPISSSFLLVCFDYTTCHDVGSLQNRNSTFSCNGCEDGPEFLTGGTLGGECIIQAGRPN